jgi:hypothetical protein
LKKKDAETSLVADSIDLSIRQLESEDDESDTEDENGVISYRKLSRRAREKKTKAIRNKIRSRNVAQYEEIQIKKNEVILKEIEALPQLLKAVEYEEKLAENKRELKKLKKIKSDEKNNMSYLEASIVPLTDELKGNLRTIKPKGVPLYSQVESMVKSGDMVAKDSRKRKAYEKPHAGKRIKWFAKYKY